MLTHQGQYMKRQVIVEPDEDAQSTTVIELTEAAFDKLTRELSNIDLGHRQLCYDDLVEFQETRMILNLPCVDGTQHIFDKMMIETHLLTVLQEGYDYKSTREKS